MGRITRFFECKEENCKAKIKRWANDNHQEEIQNCPNKKCERPTKACRSIYEGRLFGKFICDVKRGKKTCGKEWFSGNAYYNIWQECQRCRHRCTPVYLREHDKNEKNEEDEKQPHPDKLCQKCQEWKIKTGNPRARCIDYETRERRDDEINRIKATYVEGANMTKMKSLTQTQLDWRVTKDEQKKVQEEILKKKEIEKAKKNQAKYDKKIATEKKTAETELQISTKNRFETLAEEKPKTIANENTNPAKLQKSMSLDNCSWDSDSEEHIENWFYTANRVYLDAPFRLQDYKEKLESGSVKEAPSCEPYRKLYFLHLEKLAAENQSNDKKKKARNMFNNLYSVKLNEVAKKMKKLAKKEAVRKTAAKAAPKEKTENNKEKTTPAKENQKNNQKKEVPDDVYLNCDNEEDRENWFYTATQIYPDAPFRLKDYKKKLESGSVEKAPSCQPYRKLYFLHLEKLAPENQPEEKKKKAWNKFNNLYSVKLNEVANKNKKLAKKEAVLQFGKTAPKTAPKDKTGNNNEKTTSAAQDKNQNSNQKQEVSKNEYNCFYTADEVYFDAPFRLQDYKEKLESGSVKSAPMFEPYRKLYLLYSALLDAKSKPRSTGSNQKTIDANHSYLKFYSLTIQEARKMKTASTNNIDGNKENTTSAKASKSQPNESSLENKMAALTVSSSQKATRTSTSSRRVLTKLG